MKQRTIALAIVFTLSSTFAVAQGTNAGTGETGGATGVPGVKTNPNPSQGTGGNPPATTGSNIGTVESNKMGGANNAPMGGDAGTKTAGSTTGR
jgi:hypothetical protein